MLPVADDDDDDDDDDDETNVPNVCGKSVTRSRKCVFDSVMHARDVTRVCLLTGLVAARSGVTHVTKRRHDSFE